MCQAVQRYCFAYYNSYFSSLKLSVLSLWVAWHTHWVFLSNSVTIVVTISFIVCNDDDEDVDNVLQISLNR